MEKAAIISVLMGTAMSALSGMKDIFADTMAVSFEQMNPPLAILCALGGIAFLMVVVATFCKKENSQNNMMADTSEKLFLGYFLGTNE